MSDVVDQLKHFALPERKLFPCDTPSLTKASIEAFEKESSKLSTTEKIAGARVIFERGMQQRLHIDLMAKVAGRIGGAKKLADLYKVALMTRRHELMGDPVAHEELRVLVSLGEAINRQVPELRPALLDKLAERIDAFDSKWDRHGTWRDAGIPDAADTVFSHEVVEPDVVTLFGGTEIRADDLKRLSKTAGEYLSPEAMAAAKDFDSFKNADTITRCAIVSFLDRDRKNEARG